MSEVNEKSIQGTLVKPECLEEIVPKKEKAKSEKPTRKVPPKKQIITIDDTPQKVLSLDKEGYLLVFDDDPERFLELDLEVVQNLSERSKRDYGLASYYSRKLAEERLNPPSGIKVTPGYASARQQLKVEGGRKGMHRAWQRPDQERKRKRQGYKVCDDPTVETFNSTVSGTHTLGDMRGGEPEQILMEIPQELYDAEQQRLADKAVGKSRAIDQSTQASLERMGGRLPDQFGARANTPKQKEVIRKKVR